MSRDQEVANVAFAIEKDWFVANYHMGLLGRNIGSSVRFAPALRHAKAAYITLWLDTYPILQGKGVDFEKEGVKDPTLLGYDERLLYENFKAFTSLLFKTGVLTQERLNRAQLFLTGQPQAEVTPRHDY